MHLNYKQFSSGFSALEWRCHFATSSAHFQNRHLDEHLEHSFAFIEQFSVLNNLLAYQCMLSCRLNFRKTFETSQDLSENSSIIVRTLNLIFEHSLACENQGYQVFLDFNEIISSFFEEILGRNRVPMDHKSENQTLMRFLPLKMIFC